jgi:hypothetical protein
MPVFWGTAATATFVAVCIERFASPVVHDCVHEWNSFVSGTSARSAAPTVAFAIRKITKLVIPVLAVLAERFQKSLITH